MLVLSRRLNEKLLIPCIRTAIQVLSIQGGQIRLGVEAPSEIAVLREEIAHRGPKSDRPAGGRNAAVNPGGVRRALRNRLATLALGMNRVQRRLEGNLDAAARAGVNKLADDFDDLARIVNLLLDEEIASEPERPCGCAR